MPEIDAAHAGVAGLLGGLRAFYTDAPGPGLPPLNAAIGVVDIALLDAPAVSDAGVSDAGASDAGDAAAP